MNILFYSRKGGQGKTSHAVAFAHYIQAKLITFDYGNGTAKKFGPMFPNDKFLEMRPNDPLEAYGDVDNVFDFGGYLDSRVLTVAKIADFCVIPICYQSDLDIEPFIHTVTELSKHTKKIVILINNTEKEYIKDIKEAISQHFPFPVFVIPKSKYVSRMPSTHETIFTLLDSEDTSILERFTLRKVAAPFKEFYSHITKV